MRYLVATSNTVAASNSVSSDSYLCWLETFSCSSKAELSGFQLSIQPAKFVLTSMLRSLVSRPVSFGVKPTQGPKTTILVHSDHCVFVDMGHPSRLEVGSVVYNCCWSSPEQLFSGQSLTELINKLVFCSIRWETPITWRYRSRIYTSQEQGDSVVSLGSEFYFLHLLLLAGIRKRYSNKCVFRTVT
jgi:hypothetical protein